MRHDRLSPHRRLAGHILTFWLIASLLLAALGASVARGAPAPPSRPNQAGHIIPDWMSSDTAAQLNLGFDVLVPDSLPGPLSGEPQVETGDGYYQLYWAVFGGAHTFLEITGTVGGQIPAYSVYDRNNQLTVNADVQGNDAYHDVSPVYDMVYWESGGVVYSVSSLNLDTDTLSIANALDVLTPTSGGGNGNGNGDSGASGGDSGEGNSGGGDTATAAPPAENPALSVPDSVQAGQTVTVQVSGVSNATLEADDGTFVDTGDTSYDGVSDGSYRWQAPSPDDDESVSIRLVDPDNGDWLASADVTVHGQGAPPAETAPPQPPATEPPAPAAPTPTPTEAAAETAVPAPPAASRGQGNATSDEPGAAQPGPTATATATATAAAKVTPTPVPTPTKSIFDSLPTSTPRPSGQPGDGTWGSQNMVKLPTARAAPAVASPAALPSPPVASKETTPLPAPTHGLQPPSMTATPEAAKAPVVTGVIGPQGGELVNPAGAKLVFPAGALASETTVRIAQLPDAQLPVSSAVDLIPGSGFDITLTPVSSQSATLQKPVTLTLTLDAGKWRKGTIIYWLHDGTLSAVAHSQLNDTSASVALSHFSRYVAGVPTPDDSPSASRLAWILAAIGALVVLALLTVIIITARRRWR